MEANAPPADDHHAHDRFYVHGYSDKRQDNELDRAAGNRPAPLPYRFQYVTVERSSGLPTNEKVADYKGRGYVPVMFDEAAQYGIDPKLSAFVRGPDGTCRQGSQMLMVAPKEAAARDFRLQREATQALFDAPKAAAQRSADAYNQKMGLSGNGATAFEFDEEIITDKR